MEIKVLLAIDEFEGPIAGTETQFWRLVTGLKDRNVSVGIMSLRDSAFLKKEAPDIPSYSLNVTKLLTLRSLLAAWRAGRWAKRNGYQIVHTFLNDVSIILPWAMRLSGIRVVISRRDEGFWYTQGTLLLLKFNRLFISRVVANCRTVAELVANREQYRQNKVNVIYNGIEEAKQEMGPSECWRRMLLPHDTTVITIVANLRPLKRIGDAIQAFAVSKQNGLNGLLVIAGEDRAGQKGPSHRAELEALAERLGIKNDVRFLGYVDNANEIISETDIGLLFSETEGLSNTIMQFMQAGKPVIASNIGGNAELIVDGLTGFLVDVGDVPQMAVRILELAEDSNKRNAMGDAGRAIVTEKFNLRHMLNQYIELYEEVIR